MKKTDDVIYEHTQVENILHHVNVWFLPFRWGINTYRGCEHNCIYCNARYTHEYLGLPTGEFAHKIIVKDNAAEILDKELSKEKWNKKWTVNLSTVTYPYQPAERQFKITQDVLKVFLKHHNALMVTTKSDLILRDIEILSEIAQTGFLNVVLTIPLSDEELQKNIEPKAPSFQKRIDVLNKIHKAGITVGVTAIPLFPQITDGEKDVEKLVKIFAENGADYVIIDLLNFREETRNRIMPFIKEQYPTLVSNYEELYKTNYCDKEYAKQVRKYANRVIKKYHVDKYDKMFSYHKSKSI
ncbi:Radical SAM superfamily protein [uncultured archaeon]|nr:Radical SAM superfamily protein [uncultured archaeon]